MSNKTKLLARYKKAKSDIPAFDADLNLSSMNEGPL